MEKQLRNQSTGEPLDIIKIDQCIWISWRQWSASTKVHRPDDVVSKDEGEAEQAM